MGEKGIKYDDEFKRNAVDHLIRSGKSNRQAAADLGVSEHSLRMWKSKYLSEEGGPQQITLEEEVLRLRAQVNELQEEREILKKSVAIFLKPRK